MGDSGCYYSQYGQCCQVVYVYLNEEQTKKLLFPFFGFINNRVTELSKLCVLKVIRIVNGPIIVACSLLRLFYEWETIAQYLPFYPTPLVVFPKLFSIRGSSFWL